MHSTGRRSRRADYGRFETPGTPVVSPDGQWLAHVLTRVNEERELRLHRLDRDSVRTEAWSSAPSFSRDSRHVAWAVDVPLDERRRLEREKEPVRLGAAVLDLRGGTERRFTEIRAFEFSPDARFLVPHGYAPDEPKGKGADLRVLNLATGVEVNFGNVASYAWSGRGALIGLLIATGTESPSGVQVYDAVTGPVQALDASPSSYRHLAWRKDSDDLAVLRSLEPGDSAKAYTLLAWRGLSGARWTLLALDARAAGLPDTLRIVEHRALAWSDDGASLTRADSADIIVFREESRDVAPDFHVTNSRFTSPRRVTNTNVFMHDYAWGRSELVEFTSETGRRLQGSLLYPANHDPTRRYPMIVYAYEILTPQHHRWRNPSERDYYNITAWSQQGYFVLLPDIVFRARDPGVSIAETLRPAGQRIADMGLIDARRVGFIGHSWGGYAATYLAAHTDIFAASVAGAPLTDFVSFMGQIHWASGNAEVDHWETGQARMEVLYWEDPDAHHRNSPIHNVHNMTTPLLMAHGDKDGVVEFFQATEFYNFARRAGKQMVLLVYEGEDHGLRRSRTRSTTIVAFSSGSVTT